MITLNHFRSESATVRELAAALGVDIRAVQARAVSEQWRFPLEGLPGDARAAFLTLRQQKAQRRTAGRLRWLRQPAPAEIAQRQEAFQRASKARRDRAEQRAAFLVHVTELVKSGASLKYALNMTSGNLPAGDVSIAPSGSYPEAVKDVGRGHITFFPSERQGVRWWGAVKGLPREHWPAFLLPEERNANRKAEVHPAAWAWFQDQYQGADRPSVASCYQQLKDAAQHHPEWAPLPSLRSFQRRAKEVQP